MHKDARWICVMCVLIAVVVPYSPVLKSISGSAQIFMRIINQGNEELTLYWVDYKGGPKSYGKIQPGETKGMNTYETHPWLIANPRDEVVGIFVPYTAAKNTDIIIK